MDSSGRESHNLMENLKVKSNNKTFMDSSFDHRKIKTMDSQDKYFQDTPDKKYPDYCRTLTVKDANGTIKELVFPKALDLDRPKRARTTFSAEQLYQLEREFQRNQYLVGRERTDLARRLGLSETQVKVWFQNRRTKFKRDKSREAEEHHEKAESLAACSILNILEKQQPSNTNNRVSEVVPPTSMSQLPAIRPIPPFMPMTLPFPHPSFQHRSIGPGHFLHHT